jgi:Na+-driven multidrug efflux pump
MVTSLGTTAIAAHFVAIRVASLSYMPAHGLAIAVSTLVGQSLGAQRVDLANSRSPVYFIRNVVLWSCWGCYLSPHLACWLVYSVRPGRIPFGVSLRTNRST